MNVFEQMQPNPVPTYREVRCSAPTGPAKRSCNRLLAAQITAPFEIKCGKCGSVTRCDEYGRSEVDNEDC